jgi:hypothetical protein
MLVSGVAQAGTSVEGTISRVAMGWGGEGVYVILNEAVAPVEGCMDPRYYMPKDAPLFKENLAMLLSAFHAQTKVGVYVVGCFSPYKVHQISAVDTSR